MVAIGEVLDEKYRITRLIGEGGMGAVYEGENVLIGRRVAIKVLHTAMASNQQIVERFQREARAAGRIGNDHILEVLDLGKLPDGDRYMVLEFLDGEPLSNRIERLGKLTPAQAAPLAVQILSGLGAAHRAGIVHRDLKPDNIFILKEKAGQKDFVKIIDFGISKFSPLAGEDGMKMTQTGAIMGTPYYMSPEQARGSLDADLRSDIYSVGVILYEALTGNVPFTGHTVNELIFSIALSEPKPMHELVPDLDRGFETVVNRALVKDREQRYQTAEEFAEAIASWVPGRAPQVSAPEIIAVDVDVSAQQRQQLAVPGTTGSWTQSQAGAIIAPPQRRSGRRVAATLFGLVLLGTAGFTAFRSMAPQNFAADSGPTPAAAVPPPAEAKPVTPPAVPAQPTLPPAPQPVIAPAVPTVTAAPSSAPEAEPTTTPTARTVTAPRTRRVAVARKPTPSTPTTEKKDVAPAEKKPSIRQFGY